MRLQTRGNRIQTRHQFCERVHELLRRRLSDTAIAEKCFPQSRVAVGTFDRLVTFGAEPLDDLIDQRRIVCGPDRD